MNYPFSTRNTGCSATYPLEVSTVEETKHLVPNLALLARALFGDNAYLTKKQPRVADWITEKNKLGDGLLWEPWKDRLWLIEIEWKERSNFFDQVRAFSRSRIDEAKLRSELANVLTGFAPALESVPHLKEGAVTQAIIDRTIRNHVSSGHFQPHVWVILGHEGNREKLRETYEEELKTRFGASKHYILSMARLFQSDCSRFILLEQSCSENLSADMTVPSSLLVPVGISLPSEAGPSVSHTETATDAPLKVAVALPHPAAVTVGSSQPRGKGLKMWEALRTVMKKRGRELSQDDYARVQLRITVSGRSKVFELDWNSSWSELKVFNDRGESVRCGVASKEYFKDQSLEHVARNYGVFVFEQTEQLADYRTVEKT